MKAVIRTTPTVSKSRGLAGQPLATLLCGAKYNRRRVRLLTFPDNPRAWLRARWRPISYWAAVFIPPAALLIGAILDEGNDPCTNNGGDPVIYVLALTPLLLVAVAGLGPGPIWRRVSVFVGGIVLTLLALTAVAIGYFFFGNWSLPVC
jgi:hypothetical protein